MLSHLINTAIRRCMTFGLVAAFCVPLLAMSGSAVSAADYNEAIAYSAAVSASDYRAQEVSTICSVTRRLLLAVIKNSSGVSPLAQTGVSPYRLAESRDVLPQPEPSD